jgi:hypothetical protein
MVLLRKGIDMSDQPISARPLNGSVKMLREKFHISFTAQSGLMN